MTSRLRRQIAAGVAVLLLLGGLGLTAAYFQLRRSVQPYGGSATLPGLEREVTVSFDEFAVPSVRADGEGDLFRAQGWLHASERLWQMELFLRIARGRLAELFGEEALEVDRLARTLDLWGAAARAVSALGPRERSVLDAYVEGVNAKVGAWTGPWPPEFVLLGIEPQPWSATASVAVGKIMALDLSGWGTELDRIAARAVLPSTKAAFLDLRYPSWGPTILQDPPPEPAAPARTAAPVAPGEGAAAAQKGAGASQGALPAVSATGASRPESWDPIAFLSGFALSASNSWALDGSRTADGHPLLASDMHLTLRAPSTWYLNALHAGESGLSVAGLSIAGVPGVVVGYNEHVAWGFTNAMVDDADFIVESIDLDGSAYRTGGEWRRFDVREERIGVRGRSDPVIHRVRETVRGPVITDVVQGGGLTLSLIWTGLYPTGEAAGLLRMNRAATAAQFDEAVRSFRSPHQNVIYVTTEGELGYRMSGSVPRRRGVDGTGPISFERLEDGWDGFWPPDSLPALTGPASGYLASANNLQSWPSFGPIGVDYPLPFRARRIVDRVSRASGWGVDSMRALQLDVYSLWAERVVPRAVAAARRIGEVETAATLDGWDRRAALDSPGATLFYVWLYRLRQLIAADEYAGGGWFPDFALLDLLEAGGGPWVDVVGTEPVESLEALEDAAMGTAIEHAAGRPWGAVHRERSTHLLGQVAWLDRVFRFHVGPHPAPGGRHTVRPDDPFRWAPLDSTSWRLPRTSGYGPSERFVAHMDPERPRGYFLLPTGQSGNPFSRHYRDMADRWTGAELIELPLGRQPPGSAVASSLRLVPGERRDDREQRR